jgi:hypothetical protein
VTHRNDYSGEQDECDYDEYGYCLSHVEPRELDDYDRAGLQRVMDAIDERRVIDIRS